MATFAKATFNTATYAVIRPTYPEQLYQFIFQYHDKTGRARWDKAIDLGCGTGQVTTELTRFKHVYGIDPSQGMIDTCERVATKKWHPMGLTFMKGSAEDLSQFKDQSVDMVVAGQAVHWFDYARLWPELARVLRPNGTFAFWGYSEFRFAKYPSLTPMIREYAQGKDPKTSLGPHWQQPGRQILDNHLFDIPQPPESKFKDWQHIKFTGSYYPKIADARPVILKRTLTWEGLESYLRTFSSLHTFHEQNPEDEAKKDIGEGDIVQRFVTSLKGGIKAVGCNPDEDIDIEWPLALIMARRK
ncbi:hypothetical protein SISNIDRAFT_458050 [Sistotremastrum niveocremeum HHB9708]|uniref:Methyltransferase type 11 domain-containing protein n=1 Tax=Sistotremastrum niveocremeum HHB9708 TaxID=1314777 RepID=A0A164R0G6_9AGAM|nr:hypothetical protein SISNIDRAFT_458050 [Sistotremastrum niveocremeum HHB9708]